MIASVLVFMAAVVFVALLASVTVAYVARESGPKVVNRLAMLAAFVAGTAFICILGAMLGA